MFTRKFWRDATERALSTGAQTVLTGFFVGDVALNALTADWANMGGFFAGGVVFAYLKALAFGAKHGTPSATGGDGEHRADD